jgi:hypothetical protein
MTRAPAAAGSGSGAGSRPAAVRQVAAARPEGGGATGGGGMTGGGSTTGGGAGLPLLTWAAMGISGVTSNSYIIGFSGAANDLWAVQDTGHLFHSTGGAFTRHFAFQYGARDLYASGGTVVMIQTRSIRTCVAPSPCTQDSDFQQLDLLNSGMNWNFFGEALCGRGPNDITAIVSDTTNNALLFTWNGTSWSRGPSLGIAYPQACWFDANGGLYVSGQDAVLFYDQGAGSLATLSSNFTGYNRGAVVDGTSWLSGPYDYVARGTGTSFTPVVPIGGGGNQLLWTVGGLRSDEVFALGYYQATNAVGIGFKWNGTQLRPVGNLIPGFGQGATARVIHVTEPNELFVAGGDSSGPLITRGRR